MIPFWWACWIAWQTGTNSSSRSLGGQMVLVAVLRDRHALDQFHHEVGPAAVASCPRRSTLAMFGWSISARACRSASKRAITCRESMPALMILSATSRLSGSHLLGHEDGAHAPFADLLQQLVGADLRARTHAAGWSISPQAAGSRETSRAARGIARASRRKLGARRRHRRRGR